MPSMLERIKETLINRAAELAISLGSDLTNADYMKMRTTIARLDEVLKALQQIEEEEQS